LDHCVTEDLMNLQSGSDVNKTSTLKTKTKTREHKTKTKTDLKNQTVYMLQSQEYAVIEQ